MVLAFFAALLTVSSIGFCAMVALIVLDRRQYQKVERAMQALRRS